MPRDIYSELHFHITWHAKGNAPLIQPELERPLYTFLRDCAQRTQDVVVHAVGGTEDHVHLAVTIPPTLLVSEWIGKLKGASAHYINHRVANHKALAWQSGYGVVSFGTKYLPWVVDYVKHQKQHHAKGRVTARLERIESPLKRAEERVRKALVNRP